MSTSYIIPVRKTTADALSVCNGPVEVDERTRWFELFREVRRPLERVIELGVRQSPTHQKHVSSTQGTPSATYTRTCTRNIIFKHKNKGVQIKFTIVFQPTQA